MHCSSCVPSDNIQTVYVFKIYEGVNLWQNMTQDLFTQTGEACERYSVGQYTECRG
jgi:hypothetical protein